MKISGKETLSKLNLKNSIKNGRKD